jgi:hypothetical protein
MYKNKGKKNSGFDRPLRATDRRISQRFSFGWDAVIRRSDKSGRICNDAGKLRNLSSGGAYVVLAHRLNVGDKIEICIKLPLKGENWVKYAGRVVRLKERDAELGAAVRFERFRPEFIRAVRNQA